VGPCWGSFLVPTKFVLLSYEQLIPVSVPVLGLEVWMV
jgi:hypothetical protein